ncbi:glutathione S-transferase family protein [Rhodovibrionaceae bacterium A322]
MQPEIVVHGFPESVYLRAVLMTCDEKGLSYRSDWSVQFESDAHFKLHPFGKVPVLEIGSFKLFETNAICRYLDEAYPGPSLQPVEVQERAEMNQWLSIIDSYAYPWLVTQLVAPRRAWIEHTQVFDPDAFVSILPKVDKVCDALDERLGRNPWLSGQNFGLADILLAPMMFYFAETPEGQDRLPPFSHLGNWFNLMRQRPSFRKHNYVMPKDYEPL